MMDEVQSFLIFEIFVCNMSPLLIPLELLLSKIYILLPCLLFDVLLLNFHILAK